MRKATLEEIIHEGAGECFDHLGYLPADPTFGWSKNNPVFSQLVELSKKIVEYIGDHKIHRESFGGTFKKELLSNRHYVILSILGNKVEYLLLKGMSEADLNNYFEGSDEYHTADDIREALEFLQDVLKKKWPDDEFQASIG